MRGLLSMLVVLQAGPVLLQAGPAWGQPWAFRDESPVLPPRPGPARPRPFAAGPTVIYLATLGITIAKGASSDATQDESPLCGAAVPPFDSTPFGTDRAGIVADLAARTEALFAPFDVRVVTERPTQGPYDLVALGGLAPLCGLAAGFAGYSPLDCGDAGAQDVCFVFSEGITSLQMLAVIIAHEVGHAHGLPHTAEACDVMSNLLCAPEDKRFFDAPLAVTPDHAGRCGLGATANSYQLLLAALGPRRRADGGGGDRGVDAGSDLGVDAASRDAGVRDAGVAPPPPSDGCSAGRALATPSPRGLLPWPLALLLTLLAARRHGKLEKKGGKLR